MPFYQPEVRHIALQLLEKFASSLEAERIRRGLSNEAFAELISISGPRYSAWLSGRGNPSLKTIVAVSNRLEWEEERLEWLFREAGKPMAARSAVGVESRQMNHYNDWLTR